MDVPPVSHPAWKEIVSGEKRRQFEFLATNLLLGYLTLQVKRNSSPEIVQKCAQELHDIFVRNADLGSVQRDLIKIFGRTPLSGYLYDVIEVKSKITHGDKLLLAGDENLLKMLPPGNWIGGSIPYFMTEEGGLTTRHKIYVTELPHSVSDISIKVYDVATLVNVYTDAAQNGFSAIIMPGSSNTHFEFALHAPQYKDFGHSPLIGWIAGVHLDDLGKITPKVFYGPSQTMLENAAVVLHATLQPGYVAEINYVNIFEQGEGDTITFLQDGFSASEVYINGVKTNFADYVAQQNLDMRLPLVADYFGARVNVSFQNVDTSKREVRFYAPVFAGVSYKHAKPLRDYVQQFTSMLPLHLSEHPAFSCNCILNYLYSKLEGKRTGKITGPATFGEVVYQLLNQTMAYLTVTEVS
ncbi:MAG: DUF6976 family protein [Chloroflexota bacterium]